MGLGIRCGSARPVILPGDSSVKADGTSWTNYAGSLFDERHLVLDPGDPPVHFMLRPLTDEQKDIIAAQPTGRARAKLAVRCSWLSHDGYKAMVGGSIVDVPQPHTADEGRLGTVITEKWLKTLGIEGHVGGLPDIHLAALYQAVDKLSEATLPLPDLSAAPSGPLNGSSQESGQFQSPAPREGVSGDAASKTDAASAAA